MSRLSERINDSIPYIGLILGAFALLGALLVAVGVGSYAGLLILGLILVPIAYLVGRDPEVISLPVSALQEGILEVLEPPIKLFFGIAIFGAFAFALLLLGGHGVARAYRWIRGR